MTPSQPRWRLFLKRTLDFELALLGLLVLSPVLLGLAVAVRRRLGPPVLFVHTRPGRFERQFRLVKFRTMTDARDEYGRLKPNADRLVPLGRFLRERSLDELPELFNVLKGEMSLVGPRPLLIDYLEYYTPEERQRHALWPGITGLAQISGRNALDWDAKIALDLEYVRRFTLWTDVEVLLLTVLKVVRRGDPGDVRVQGGSAYPDGFRRVVPRAMGDSPSGAEAGVRARPNGSPSSSSRAVPPPAGPGEEPDVRSAQLEGRT